MANFPCHGNLELLDSDLLSRRLGAPLGEILRSVPGLAVNGVGVMG